MKDELRAAVAEAMADKSESQAEMGGAGLPAVLSVAAAAAKSDAIAAEVVKSGKAHFPAKLIFLPSFFLAANHGAQSKPVKPGQTNVLGQAGGQIVCKHLTMNDLQIIRRPGRSNPVKVNQTDCEGLISHQRIQLRRTQSQSVAAI